MSEITLESLAQELKELRQEVEVYHRTARRLDQHVEEFKNSNSSRRGLEGGRGPEGRSGRDAVLVVRTDSGSNTVKVFDESGVEKATLISVPGPRGETGPPGKDSIVPGPRGVPGKDSTIPGPQGLPGKDSVVPGPRGETGASPDIDEIVLKVLKELESYRFRK